MLILFNKAGNSLVFSQCFGLCQNLINFDIYSDPGHIGKHLTALLYYFEIINYQLDRDLMKKNWRFIMIFLIYWHFHCLLDLVKVS